MKKSDLEKNKNDDKVKELEKREKEIEKEEKINYGPGKRGWTIGITFVLCVGIVIGGVFMVMNLRSNNEKYSSEAATIETIAATTPPQTTTTPPTTSAPETTTTPEETTAEPVTTVEVTETSVAATEPQTLPPVTAAPIQQTNPKTTTYYSPEETGAGMTFETTVGYNLDDILW